MTPPHTSESPVPAPISNDPNRPFVVCVFCGANSGATPEFTEATHALARVFAKNNWNLVYGGGTVGLMGELSRTLVSLSGPSSVHGIMPRALVEFELGGSVPSSTTYGHTTIVADMHTRKATMGKMSNAFVVLPGGYGTMEELFEIVTWNQLGIHDCPIVIVNVAGFYDGILGWIKKATDEEFIKSRGIIVEVKSAEEVEGAIRDYEVASGRMNLDWKNE
jgi:uncharacterized protein (TIGR00730 family)